MACSSNMSPSKEEEDPRSIRIRTGYKRLQEYFDILTDTAKFYDINKLEIFDDIFRSFLNEEGYNTCFEATKLLLQKIEYYDLFFANCKLAFNIGILLDHFLTKFKKQLSEDDKNSLLEKMPNIKTDSLVLHNLKDTQYVITLILLKHFYPELYEQVEINILARLKDVDGTDDCVKNYINCLEYLNERTHDLICFEFRSFVLIRNTMIITDEFIKKTMDMLQEEDYRDDWIAIYANKVLSHIIVPFVAYKQKKINLGKVQIDDMELLQWLLAFSEKSFGQKAREEKFETIYDEDFALTWQFVKENASKKQRQHFYKYLIENGFEFHLSDPHSESCFKDVTRD